MTSRSFHILKNKYVNANYRSHFGAIWNIMIADVTLKNKMYYVLDEKGKEIAHDWESNMGELMGFTSEFIVFLKNKMYYTRDEKMNEIAHDWETNLGDFKNAAGTIVNFVKNKMIYTKDKKLKEISHRWA